MNFSQSAVFNIVASLGLIFINVIIGIVEARILGPQELGRYNIFLTTQTMFVTLFALGIGQSCIYFINSLKKKESEVITTSVKIILPFSFIASFLLFFVLFYFKSYFMENNVLYLAFFCLGSNALLVNTIFIPVLLANMQVVKNQIVKYVSRIITLILILIIVVCNLRLEVGSLISITGMTNVISLCLLYYYLKEKIDFSLPVNKSLSRSIIGWGIKLAGNNIAAIILTSMPVYFLSWFSIGEQGFSNVGYFTRASSILVIGTIIASSIGPLLYAKWSTLKGEAVVLQVKKVSFLLFVMNSFIALFIVLFSSFIIRILYGEAYVQAVPILRILSLTLILNGMKEVCYGLLSSQVFPMKIFKNLFISIILMSILLYFAISYWGIIGCAVSTLLITFVSTFLLMLSVVKISNIEIGDFFTVPRVSEVKMMVLNLRKK